MWYIVLQERGMAMTKEAFVAILLKLAPWTSHYMINEKLALPKICEMVAVQCFTEKRPDDEFTEALRYQLLQLKSYARFDFEPSTPDTHEGVIIK